MIVRSWSGHTTATGGERYVAYFRNILLPKLQSLDGHRGAMVLTRGASEGEEVEVTVLTFWDSMASIRRFAGADPAAAVVEPEAETLLKRFDARVKHFEVLVDERT
jgi:heme-degrading monooxygenase HmoA